MVPGPTYIQVSVTGFKWAIKKTKEQEEKEEEEEVEEEEEEEVATRMLLKYAVYMYKIVIEQTIFNSKNLSV